MLDGLSDIDWLALNASHIPDLLQELASSNLEVRKDAYNKLSEDLVPWEVFDGLYVEELLRLVMRQETLFTIPFLLRMLENETVKNKENLLILLYYLASYMKLDQFLKEENREQYLYYAKKIYTAVYKGVYIYIKLAQSSIIEIRNAANELVELMSNRSERRTNEDDLS